jgi:lysine 2,3-aminomutase
VSVAADREAAAAAARASWHDWRWQLRHRVRSLADLARALELTEAERRGGLAAERGGLPISVTPYYLRLCEPHDPSCPLRRQVVPHLLESRTVPGEHEDPLSERQQEVAPSLVRRYPDRALFLVTELCPTYCRFCTRRRRVGRRLEPGLRQRVAAATRYLHAHPEVRDVIVSGGDPLMLGTGRLVRLLSEFRRVPSVDVIRLATRSPATLPQRVTEELVTALRTLHPIWVMTHFNHPKELTVAARQACRRLVEAGFPVNNQTVLLRGVNDRAEVLAQLFRGLVRERVRPYYLLQADPVAGTSHLRTPVQTGLSIMQQLQGTLSGIALPKLILDTPGGLGKVPLCPGYVLWRADGVTRVRSPRGAEVDYTDPS